jgi:translation initiation factor RLI1
MAPKLCTFEFAVSKRLHHGSFTPVKTGVQNYLNSLDSCFRRNDKTTELRLFTKASFLIYNIKRY